MPFSNTVIDASIAVKWFLDEEDSEVAERLMLDGVPFIAPALIKTEVTAAIAKAERIKKIDDHTAHLLNKTWFDILEKGSVFTEDIHEDSQHAFDLAIEIGHQYQDCLYLAVAQRHKLPFLTADKKLIEKARSADVNVKTLENFQS
ncbi:MAG: type II toxin-antitoxin system VapC family toxin [Pseudomonadota bacterium]